MEDEFLERRKRAFEVQRMATEYAAQLRRHALAFLSIGFACVVLMWLAWRLATWSLPAFLDRGDVAKELREAPRCGLAGLAPLARPQPTAERPASRGDYPRLWPGKFFSESFPPRVDRELASRFAAGSL